MIGLDKQWAVRAISAVGNYGEIFERNIGVHTLRWVLLAWSERTVDQRRPDVRASNPLILPVSRFGGPRFDRRIR